MPRRKKGLFLVLAIVIVLLVLFLLYNQYQNCAYTTYFCTPEGPPRETIKIASWNIQNFGQKKANDEAIMAGIAANLNGYDIIAVQEISNFYEKSDSGCPKIADICPNHTNCGLIENTLEESLNEKYNLSYQFVFSDTVRDERYLYIYNPEKVEFISTEIVSDPDETGPICDLEKNNTGKMVRQPFKAKFRAGNTTFTLLNAHTSPTKNIAELEGLEYFYRQEKAKGDENLIILGDLNADCDYLTPGQQIAFRSSQYRWIVSDSEDTTVSKRGCAYDRFIFGGDAKSHYTGKYGISSGTTSQLSDHYLIWAEFTI